MSPVSYNSFQISPPLEGHSQSLDKSGVDSLRNKAACFNRYQAITVKLSDMQVNTCEKGKKLWDMKKKSFISKLSSTNSLNLRENLKETINNFLSVGSGYLSDTDKLFANEFSNDLINKTLHEFRSKYFNTNSAGKLNLNLPFVSDLIKFFADKDKFNDSTIDDYLSDEENTIVDRLKEQVEPKAMNRNEMLRLLVYLKEISREENEKQPLSAYVIDHEEMKPFLDVLCKNSFAETKRVQLLVRNDVHYTALEIELSPQGKKCVIMDAFLDSRYLNIAALMREYSFDKIYCAGNNSRIQFDAYNCSTFTFSHLTKSSGMPDFFNLIESLPQNFDEQQGIHFIDWINFPANMIKNAQSMTFLAKHKEWLQPKFKGGVTFKDYVDSQSVERSMKGITKSVNIGIDKKFDSYAGKIQNNLKSIEPQFIMSIVSADPVVQLRNDLEAQAKLTSINRQISSGASVGA